MPTDKIAKIDLTNLTDDSISQLIKIKKDIANDLDKTGKRNKPGVNEFQRSDESTEKLLEKLKKEVQLDLLSGKGKETLKSKLFGNQDFSKGGIAKNLVSFGLNPGGVIGGLLKTGIPGFGAAVAATAIIVKILKKFDDLEKRFTDDIRTRLNQERDNEQTARVQAGLVQEFYSPGPGITDPRDGYNTYDEFNNNQKRIEEDYNIRSTLGVE